MSFRPEASVQLAVALNPAKWVVTEAFIRVTEHLNQQCLACQTHVANSTANIGACPAAMLFWCSWENGSERIEGESGGLRSIWQSTWI